MIKDIFKRVNTLTKACLKVAVILPSDKPLLVVAREKLIAHSSDMNILSRGLLTPTLPELFRKNLGEAQGHANACSYWLEVIAEETSIDNRIITPIIEECNSLGALFGEAMKKVKLERFLG